DLLAYLPTRYEDRSSTAEIRHLYHDVYASLDLTVRLAQARRISFRNLFVFTISAVDQKNTGPQVIIEWFVSGPRAKNIIEYHSKRFARGARFIAFGKWERDNKRGTYLLKLHKPDELELISSTDDEESNSESDPALAAIHVGRRVPIYRKLGE